MNKINRGQKIVDIMVGACIGGAIFSCIILPSEIRAAEERISNAIAINTYAMLYPDKLRKAVKEATDKNAED